MNICMYETAGLMGRYAAQTGAEEIEQAIIRNGKARIILATGASQFDMLDHLVRRKSIDWSRVEAFHLDEYIGIPVSHKASFRKYMKERVLARLPELNAFHYIDADRLPLEEEISRLNSLISAAPMDVAFIGIGENGHLAFNDPPADVETEEPYIVVTLNDDCKQQQVNEGWFASREEVPAQAVSMSIRQILKARTIICSVPDGRKKEAVRMCVHDVPGPHSPCAYLREHKNCYLMVDRPAAALIL